MLKRLPLLAKSPPQENQMVTRYLLCRVILLIILGIASIRTHVRNLVPLKELNPIALKKYKERTTQNLEA